MKIWQIWKQSIWMNGRGQGNERKNLSEKYKRQRRHRNDADARECSEWKGRMEADQMPEMRKRVLGAAAAHTCKSTGSESILHYVCAKRGCCTEKDILKFWEQAVKAIVSQCDTSLQSERKA